MSAQPSSTAELKLGRLEGKVALITGGANEAGFGAAISRRFVSEGAKVLIGDLDGDGAESVAKKLNSANVKGIKMDVTDEGSWKTAVETIVKDFGRLDIVINNAGTTYRNKPTAEVTEDEWERVFKVNVKSIFWSAKVAIPQMQKQGAGGAMVNISSIGSIRPRPGLVWYNASKGAVSNVSNLQETWVLQWLTIPCRRRKGWQQNMVPVRFESMRSAHSSPLPRFSNPLLG